MAQNKLFANLDNVCVQKDIPNFKKKISEKAKDA